MSISDTLKNNPGEIIRQQQQEIAELRESVKELTGIREMHDALEEQYLAVRTAGEKLARAIGEHEDYMRKGFVLLTPNSPAAIICYAEKWGSVMDAHGEWKKLNPP